jgi:hypothetical protein
VDGSSLVVDLDTGTASSVDAHGIVAAMIPGNLDA